MPGTHPHSHAGDKIYIFATLTRCHQAPGKIREESRRHEVGWVDFVFGTMSIVVAQEQLFHCVCFFFLFARRLSRLEVSDTTRRVTTYSSMEDYKRFLSSIMEADYVRRCESLRRHAASFNEQNMLG